MTQLQYLRRQAKERGLKGYSTLSKFDHQVSFGTQSDFRPCATCGLEALMCLKAAAERRIAYKGDLEIDVATGEVVGCGIESGIKFVKR